MNGNEKNPSVSIAIPKAKPKMERLSPGVYRNGEGNLVGGQGQMIPGSRPSYQSVARNLAKQAPPLKMPYPVNPGQGGQIKDVLPGAAAGANPKLGAPNMDRLLEIFNRYKSQNPSQGLADMVEEFAGAGSQPIPKMPSFSQLPGLTQPSDVTPELHRLVDRALNATTPQIPRSNSISDLLRRR